MARFMETDTGVVAHAYNCSTWNGDADRPLWVQGHPGINSLSSRLVRVNALRLCFQKGERGDILCWSYNLVTMFAAQAAGFKPSTEKGCSFYNVLEAIYKAILLIQQPAFTALQAAVVHWVGVFPSGWRDGSSVRACFSHRWSIWVWFPGFMLGLQPTMTCHNSSSRSSNVLFWLPWAHMWHPQTQIHTCKVKIKISL